MLGSKLCCDRCGTTAVSQGIENVPAYMQPFVRGDVVNVVRSLGICGECYAVLCSNCASNGRCSVCNSPFPLLAQCPSTPPPIWKVFKRLKWQKLVNKQFD